MIRSICLWARRSQSPVPGSGRESSDVATMRSSGVRSARSSPAAWPRSIKLPRAVRTSAWQLARGRGEDEWAAVQGKHEAVAVAQGGQEEQADAVQGGPGVGGGRPRVVDSESERAVDERAEQVFAGGEVPVDGADAHAGAVGDVGHRHLLALAPDQLGRGVEHAFAVGGGVLAGLARGWHADEDRSVCPAESGWYRPEQKRMNSSGTQREEASR